MIGKAQKIPRDDLDRTANGHRHVDAGVRKIKRDLAARIAEADHEHARSGEGNWIAIVNAVDDGAGIVRKTRP